GVDPAEPAAAELVSDIDPGEPQLRRPAQCLDRELLAFVPARGVRQPILAGKGSCRLGKGPLLFGQRKIHVTINGIEENRYSRGARILTAMRSPRKPSGGRAHVWRPMPDADAHVIEAPVRDRPR